MSEHFAPMPPEPTGFAVPVPHGYRDRRVVDVIACLVLWAVVFALALISAFWFFWHVAMAGTFSSPSCTGQPDTCAEAERESETASGVLLLAVVVIPGVALVVNVVVAFANRAFARRGPASRRLPLFVWPLLAIACQALCLMVALS